MSKFYSTGKAPASYPARDIGLKVERADKHIQDCRVALEEFICTHPYEIVRQADLKSDKIVYIVEKATPVPGPIRAIVGDAIQNLRTTLDYLAQALVVANHRTPSKDTSFPILKGDLCSEPYKTAFEGKVKGMGNKAIEAIKRLKPYKGGNDPLYRIHALNNRDKHRLLLAAGCAASRFTSEPIDEKVMLDPEQLEKALADRFVSIPGGFPLV